MISTRSAGLLIDTVVCLTLAKWETVSGRFGGYLRVGDCVSLGDHKPNADPHKTVPIPHCLRADRSTLCQCVRAGVLVADDVCPGHCMAAHYRPKAPQLHGFTWAAPTVYSNPLYSLKYQDQSVQR